MSNVLFLVWIYFGTVTIFTFHKSCSILRTNIQIYICDGGCCCCCPLIVMIYPLPETNSVEWHIIFGMQRNEYVTMSIGKWSHWFRVRHCELACLRYSSSNPFLAKLNYVLHNILRLLLNKSVFFFCSFMANWKRQLIWCNVFFCSDGCAVLKRFAECVNVCVCVLCVYVAHLDKYHPNFSSDRCQQQSHSTNARPAHTHTHIFTGREREREHKQHMN